MQLAFTRIETVGSENDWTNDIEIGDIDGDGDFDLIRVGSNQSYIHINDGAGRFSETRLLGTATDSLRIAKLGDLDGDGDLDIAVSTALYINDGKGYFTVTATKIGAPVALGDLNSDGALDIVTDSSIYFNNGEGQFQTSVTFGAGAEILGDMNRDGLLDIVALGSVYINEGAGQTFSMKEYTAEAIMSHAIAVADMNEDMWPDIVFATTARTSGHLQVLQNDGTVGFTATTTYTLNGSTPHLALEDISRDGRPDIVVAQHKGPKTIYITGAEQPVTFGSSDDYVLDVAVADMNSDLYLDVIVGNLMQPSIIFFGNGAGTSAYSYTSSLAPGTLGDLDNDKDLDIIAPTGVLLNDGTGAYSRTQLVDALPGGDAIGDMDGNGSLDVIDGGVTESRIYFNDGFGRVARISVFGVGADNRSCLAIGDLNNDSALDVVGAGGTYFNDSAGQLLDDIAPVAYGDHRQCILGDVDSDSDLDLITLQQHESAVLVVYFNNGAGGWSNSRLTSLPSSATVIAFGDLNNDDYSDIALGRAQNHDLIYLNDRNGNFHLSGAFGSGTDRSTHVMVGDIDGDGDLDIALANAGEEEDAIYLNDGSAHFESWISIPNLASGSHGPVSLGDIDGDGDIDVFGYIGVIVNNLHTNRNSANRDHSVRVLRPIPTAEGEGYSTPIILEGHPIAVPYMLSDPESNLIGRVDGFFSLDGGGHWRPAVAYPGTITTSLATSPAGVMHTFLWDPYTSGVFGQSDNVVFRIKAYTQSSIPAPIGTFRYTNTVPGPFVYPYVAANSYPFRLRGTQVQVFSETVQKGRELAEALVYRLRVGAQQGAQLFPSPERILHTDGQGYLQGRGALVENEAIMALWPVKVQPPFTALWPELISHEITFTGNVRIYFTSARPTTTSLEFVPIIQPGTQKLGIKQSNKLVLFNLDLALEWDARKDTRFMEQLTFNLQRTSQLLFDWSNGQAALGQVRIFHDARRYPAESGFNPWIDSHIRIYASNRIRPSASVGGIISPGLQISETVQGKNITYNAGQVRMGAIWNRYGETSGNLGDDWARALAHELGHYLFFLEDNYLGLDDNGMLVTVPAEGDPNTSCPGAMNDPYRESQSEFHPQSGWTNSGCTKTLSFQSTMRSDWETISKFYALTPPAESFTMMNQGPAMLPLAVTQLQVFSPTSTIQTFDAPIFYLTKPNGGAYAPGANARAYLFQDDWLTELGQPTLDQVQAWGARPGDRLCVYETAAGVLGCERISALDDQIAMQAVEAWAPEIVATPVTSRTISLRVTTSAANTNIGARLYPTDIAAPPCILLNADGHGQFTGVFPALEQPTLDGFVHVWTQPNTDSACTEPQGDATLEAVTGYAVGGNPVHLRARRTLTRAGGVHLRARRAPVISADGQVMIFGETFDLYQDEEWFFTLQATGAVPDIPPGRSLVGQAYLLSASANAPDLTDASISFGYLGEQVPASEEGFLRIYFWQQDATVCLQYGLTTPCWESLYTFRDVEYNLASARTKGPGLYALLSSFEIPLTNIGWNNFAYPVPQSQTVASALASLEGAYTIVYGYQPGESGDAWKVYGPDTPDWVSDLKELRFGQGYWIYTTRATTLYLAGQQTVQAASADRLTLPPATFYGSVAPTDHLTPQPNMVVTAWIGDRLCGQSQTQLQGGSVVYSIKVAADDGSVYAGCGIVGRTVSFQVDGVHLAAQGVWDHTRLQDLSFRRSNQLFIPLIHR
ncbi:MAG: hypothetical protein BroJett021_05950 [Chloroflexota bacterium]|nr:MAG: hypothetical protein BroJett021_05950 [Chloroflexota bacterium]